MTEPTHTISRRSLAAGAAWAVPAVSLAAAAPAFAASNICVTASAAGCWPGCSANASVPGSTGYYALHVNDLGATSVQVKTSTRFVGAGFYPYGTVFEFRFTLTGGTPSATVTASNLHAEFGPSTNNGPMTLVRAGNVYTAKLTINAQNGQQGINMCGGVNVDIPLVYPNTATFQMSGVTVTLPGQTTENCNVSTPVKTFTNGRTTNRGTYGADKSCGTAAEWSF